MTLTCEHNLLYILNILQDNGVTILSLGIGSKIDLSELRTIASEPKDGHVFKIDNFDALKGKLGVIMEAACASK